MSSSKLERSGPLTGIRVMDLSIMAAGPWTGSLLAMLGAEVIKIEPPAGDGTRWVLPTQRGIGTNYLCMNVNKKHAIIDLKTDAGRADAQRIAATCDVLVQNFRVGVMDRLGLGYETLSTLNPQLVYCSISGFGERGPLSKAGCGDPIMQAFSGFARSNGSKQDIAEAFRGTAFLDLATASAATTSILAALLDRDAIGTGQKIEVSMLEAAFEIQCTRIAEMLGAGMISLPRGSESSAFFPDCAFETADREIFLTVHNNDEWKEFCAAIRQPGLASDRRFATNRLRSEHRQELNAVLAPIFRALPSIWWLRVLQRHQVPVVVAQYFETFRYHEQVLANEMLVRLATPDWGEISVAGTPWKFCATPCAVRQTARPGQHTLEVMVDLDTRRAREATVPAAASLKGLRVVEFTCGVAGALAGLHLAELGSDVVKLEPLGGDWLRAAAPALRDSDVSAIFHDLNRGKRSVTLHADPGEASALALSLLDRADIFITDRTETELEALGVPIATEPILRTNRGLIAIVISAYGRFGPLANRSGSELTAQAMAGYTRYLGAYDQPARRLGSDVASVCTGMFVVQAALAALQWRNRSKCGQRVDVSLFNSLLAMKSAQLAAQSDPDAYDGPRVGGPTYPPERGWKTADDTIVFQFGGAIGAEGREGWVDFVKEIGLEQLLNDPRCDKSGRNTTGLGPNTPALRATYESAFARYPAAEICSMVRKHGGNAAIYVSLKEALAHPQTQALDIVRTLEDAKGQCQKVRSFPARFSRIAPRVLSESPNLGQHTAEVEAELKRKLQ